jgi:DNA-directed RNA polymerase subunit RPC12/RpoP
MAPENEIKCPACGKWSVWEQKETDTCIHCGAILRPISDAERENIQKRREVEYVNVPINDSDALVVKLFKHVFNFIQMIFIAVISFFIWLFAAGPG